MTCGASHKTCLVIGEVDHSYRPLIEGIIERYNWRVLHVGSQEHGVYDHANYRYLKGDIENELLLKTLFVQYDFCAVCEIDVVTALVEDIARDQWYGETHNNRYIRMGKSLLSNRVVDGFLCDTSFDASVLQQNLDVVISLLDTEKPLPASLPFL